MFIVTEYAALRMKISLFKDMFNLQSKTSKDFLTSFSNFN